MDKVFFINNRAQLKEKLQEESIMVLFAGEAPQRSGDQNYIFTPNRNFYYLTGIKREKAIYMAVKTQGEFKEYLFIEKGDPVLEKWIGKRMTQDEAKEASGVEGIKYLESFESVFHQEVSGTEISYLYLDLEKRNYNSLPTRSLIFSNEIVKQYPHIKIENLYNRIAELRAIKRKEEIEKLQKAIDVTGEGIKAMMASTKAGLYEYQLEAHFDFTLKVSGIKNRAFNTIVASGRNGTVLHYEENNSQLEDGQLILLDLGAEYENYCADISRTIPVNGKFTSRQRDIYNVVLRALEETIKMVKPGVTLKELNDHTKEILGQGCKELGIIKHEDELSKYYYHGVGHFLGLDTHDVGNRALPLKAGMVVTIEPGLYIEEEGIGIRIEDDILVTETGNENLSKDIIKSVEDIEEFMKNR